MKSAHQIYRSIGFYSSFILLYLFSSHVFAEISKLQLEQTVKQGKIVELSSNNKAFLGVYQVQQLGTERGSVVILHDKREHPNWHQVVQPLRIQLSLMGWNTLSIQLKQITASELSDEKKLSEFYQKNFARISEATNYLKQRSGKKVYLIGYGISAITALRYIDNIKISLKTLTAPFNAVVLLSAYSLTTDKYREIDLRGLTTFNKPVLDIYGSHDLDWCIKEASRRLTTARQNKNNQFVQQEIHHADHFYNKQMETLVKRIHSFMLNADLKSRENN